ncbi:Aberrant root formation protein 4 [Linum grandiflorum]
MKLKQPPFLQLPLLFLLLAHLVSIHAVTDALPSTLSSSLLPPAPQPPAPISTTSMAAFSPGFQLQLGNEEQHKEESDKKTHLILAVACIAMAVIILLFASACSVFYCKKRRRKTQKNPEDVEKGILFSKFSSLRMPSSSKKSVPLIDYKALEKGTDNFLEENLLGRGGFGLVYRATMDDNSVVAVKKLDCGTEDAKREFEISASKHHFHGPSRGSKLTWHMRLKIALDTARGLEYLHEFCKPAVIHRDLKSSNILLDSNFHAKLSDFGLAVADNTRELTEKSDVYAFGIVLLELLLGRRPVEKLAPAQCQSIVTWAMPKLTNREMLPNIVDPVIKDRIDDKYLFQAVNKLLLQQRHVRREQGAELAQSGSSSGAPASPQPFFLLQSKSSYANEASKFPLMIPPFRFSLDNVFCSHFPFDQSIEGGEEEDTSGRLPQLVSFLDAVSDAAALEPKNGDVKSNAVELLAEIRRFLFSSSLDQAIVDALSFELPKAVSKFASSSDECLEIADAIAIGLLVIVSLGICSPFCVRISLLGLSVALDSLSIRDDPGCAAPLLTGLSKVFISIERRHFEQAKVVVPVVLKVLKASAPELADSDAECMHLFKRALLMVDSIIAVSRKLDHGLCEKLQSLMALFILQTMALVSASIPSALSDHVLLVSDMSKFLPQCGLTYLGLLTGSDIDVNSNLTTKEEEEDYVMTSFSDIKQGAALSVIWGHISDNIAQEAGENMSAVKDELQHNQVKRWEAISMLKHILSSVNLPVDMKRHTIDFLLCITDGSVILNSHDGVSDCITYMPGLFATSQVLADTPTSQRTDILQALITNSDSSSMTAILLDLVRGELQKENRAECRNHGSPIASIWTERILELVELVLRPKIGGPPSFPEHGDAVLSALNLYRFVIMRESAGKTNQTGVLSRTNMLKAYNEWLLPLRTLVNAIMAEPDNDPGEFASTLNPVQLVLYRCIELVEENLSANQSST